MMGKIHRGFGRCAVLLGVAWNGLSATKTDKIFSFLFKLRKIKWLLLLFPVARKKWVSKGSVSCLRHWPSTVQHGLSQNTSWGEGKRVILGFKESRP